MATIANQYDPNDPNSNSTSNSGASGTVINSTGSSNPAGNGASSSTPSASGASRAPQGPPNIAQYMAANQGAGQQLQNGIQNNFQNQANQVNQGVSNNQNQLNTQYNNSGLSNLDASNQANVIGTAFKDPQSLLNAYNAGQGNTGNTSNASQSTQSVDPTAQANYNAFNQLNTGGYNQGIQNYGSTASNDYNNLSGQVANLAQQSAGATNELGRSQLLRNTVGNNGQYNTGEQTLDNLFLQSTPGVANSLQNNLQGITNQTGANVTGFGNDAQAKVNALNTLASQGQTAIGNLFSNGLPTSTTGNAVLDQIGQNLGGQTDLTGLNQIGANTQNEYTAAQGQQTAAQALQTALQNGQTFTPDQMQQLGLTQGESLWGLTGQDLANAGGLQLNALNAYDQGGAAQVANPEEFARYNALNQLAGGPSGLQTSIFGAGATAAASPYTGYTLTNGQNGIQNAINANQQLYGVTKVNDIINQMQQQGYFGGAQGGSGMRSADPGADNRTAVGNLLLNLEQQSQPGADGKPGSVDPNQYYNQVMQAINNVWGGTFGNNYNQMGGLYAQLGAYGNTLNQMEGDTVNNTQQKNTNINGNPTGTTVYS